MPRSVSPTFIISAPRCAQPHERGVGCSYRVAWSINPHMRVGAAKPQLAIRQHRRLEGLLESLGARLHRVPFVHGAFDSIFAKDNAVLVHRTGRTHALLARPRHAVRGREQADRAAAFRGLGFDVRSCTHAFEGGDVVALPDGEAFLGHGFRSDAAAAMPLGSFLGAKVTPLELVDARLYHLDTALTVLEDGTALVCKEAFTRESLGRLRRASAITRIIDVPLAEATGFAVNAVQVGEHVVLGGSGPITERALRERGFTVHVPALDQFRLAGGSAACLVSRIHSSSEVAAASAA